MICRHASMRFCRREVSRHLLLGFSVWLVVIASAPARAQQAAAVNVRKTIQRGIPFIQTEGLAWIEDRDCLSCHHTSFMVWSLEAARRHGFDVEQQVLADSIEWALDWRNLASPASREEAVRETVLQAANDTAAQLLLSRIGRRDADGLWKTQYAEQIARGQDEDGSWKAGGQLPLQKRTQRETQEVSTMWATLALESSQLPRATIELCIERAVTWLGDDTVGVSTEWWATRLLVERARGNDKRADRLRQQLLSRQHGDGGWGWLCADESDALATGIALLALGRDGLTAADPAIRSAHAHLVDSQREDGSWPVKGTKAGAKHDVEPTAVFWGTCWAVIGICETLEPLEANNTRASAPD